MEMWTTDIVQAAASQDLISYAEVADELSSPRNREQRVKRYITDASAAIASYTRRVWRKEQVTQTFHEAYFAHSHWHHYSYHRLDGTPKPLVLARYPVISIDQVTINGGNDTLTDSDWLVDKEKGLLFRASADTIGLLPWYGVVAVTYTAGYASIDDVPPDVRQACMTLIRHRYSSAGRDPYLRSISVPGVQDESYWVGTIGDNGAIPPEVAGLLAGYIDYMRS